MGNCVRNPILMIINNLIAFCNSYLIFIHGGDLISSLLVTKMRTILSLCIDRAGLKICSKLG